MTNSVPATPPASEPTDRPAVGPVEIALPIAGMTCASCVNRIERFLGKTPGVEAATVNLATEVATIRYLPDVAGRAELVGAIQAAGYELKARAAVGKAAGMVEPTLGETMAADDAERAREQRALAMRAGVSIAVAVATMIAMFWPQTVVPMETLNRVALLPATAIRPGPAGGSTGRPGAPFGIAPRTWTRWSSPGPPPPGRTASS